MEDDRGLDDDSIDGFSVVSDVPVVLDVPSPLPIDLDPSRRITAASFVLMDEVCVLRVVPYVVRGFQSCDAFGF